MTQITSAKKPLIGKTTFVQSNKEKKYFLIDAKGKTLGRMSTTIANILTGKHRVTYAPNIDCGDAVVVINAKHVKLTGNKRSQKMYHKHTLHVGGLKTTPLSVMIDKKPEYVIRHSVWGMMRRGPLANSQIKSLRIFPGAEHNLEAQQPTKI